MKPLFKAEQYLTFSSIPSAQNDHLATDFLEWSLFSGFCLGTICANFQQFMCFQDAEYSSLLKHTWAWSQIQILKRSCVKQAVGYNTVFSMYRQYVKWERFASLSTQSQAKWWILYIIDSYFTCPKLTPSKLSEVSFKTSRNFQLKPQDTRSFPDIVGTIMVN